MKSIVFLISVAISNVFAAKLVTVPFTAIDRKDSTTTSNGRKKLGDLVNAPIENVDLAYLIDVDIGTPAQNFTLLLDTGSSTSWVPLWGCGIFCGLPKHSLSPLKSSTFSSSFTKFSIKYGEGFARGYYAKDTMTVNGVSVPEVNFAVSNFNDGGLTRDGADGILALGPDRLSKFNNAHGSVVPTLVSTMHRKGIIDENLFSIYFQPLTESSKAKSRVNGEVVFGGVQQRHYTGDITYIPITSHKVFSNYWAVDIDGFSIGRYTKEFDKPVVAMVDTGSTLVFLPKEIIRETFKDVEGLQKDSHGYYAVPCDAKLPDINITMNDHPFIIKSEHYIMKHRQYSSHRNTCYTYLQESPSFVDAILGYGFLQQFVSVYDNTNNRIGFAKRTTL